MRPSSRRQTTLTFVSVLSLLSAAAGAATTDLRLLNAVKDQNEQAARALLKEGVDVNTARADGATPLFWAVHWNDAALVDLLLKARANVNAVDDHGVTALKLACENADLAIVEKLLAAGADARHAEANGETPLMTAALSGNVAIVKALLARGADVNVATVETGQTALMWATAEGHRDVVRELIAAKADVHAQSKIGFTPLLFAARNGDIEAAKMLMAAGAGVDEPGSDGTHALPLAVVSGHDAFAEFLLGHKADANARMAGVTALHAAAGPVDMWLRDWYRARAIDNDPRSIFERLFGASGSTDPSARLARIKRDRSILDVVNEQLHRLNAKLGPGDQAKFDEYLESIRDVERRIQRAEEQNSRELPVVDQPMGIPGDYMEHAKLMMDLLALAYQTDLTRVSTFMLAREVSGRAYPEIGVSDSHHPLSHHQNEQAKLERLHKVNEYHFRQFAYLVEKLSKTAEGEGSMLDHTLFLYGTGISDSNTHFHDDLPIALVGGSAAGINGGRYIRYPQGTPLANLHVTLLDKLGVHVDKFGDSTGLLENLGVKTLPGV